jgi:hypothetical protein
VLQRCRRALRSCLEARRWRRGRGFSARRALEEEETRLLHPEVGYRSSRHSVSMGVYLISLILRSQGGADRPSPIACKGAKGRRVHPHEAALIKGAAGDWECGDGDERSPAQRSCSRDGGHDNGGLRVVDFAGAGPSRRQSGGGGGGPG